MLHAPVWCRAREWHVLGVRRHADALHWQVARDGSPARTFVSPPDVVCATRARPRQASRRTWTHAALALARGDAPVWWPVRARSLPIAPLPWQYVPAMALLSGHHRRLLLADDVGMGKTIQAGVLLHEVHAREPDACSLVVVPAGLVAQWADELQRRVAVDAHVLDAAALRQEAGHPERLARAARAGGCWLTSLDLIRQPEVTHLLDTVPWTLLVVDEAHLAAVGTARRVAIDRLAAVSVRVLLLSATPHANGASALDALRRVGTRGTEPPMLVVRRPVSLLGSSGRRVRTFRVRLDADHLALCTRLDRFAERALAERGSEGLLPALVLRRRASSCPAALARSLHRRLDVLGQATRASGLAVDSAQLSLPLDPTADTDGEDDEAMRLPAWGNESDERAELDELLRMATALRPDGGKVDAVARLVRRCREPAVVFTSYLDTLRVLRQALEPRRVVIAHGSLPHALRTEAIARFTSGEADVLITTDASAEGLNLHVTCRLVIHADVPSSARVFLQRTGRVDRYGQRRRVHAIVMGSSTFDDTEALARWRTRHDEADDVLRTLAPERCRRTELAARLPAVESASSPASGALRCVVTPRRLSRLAQRMGLPANARRIVVGLVRWSGDPELSSWQRVSVHVDEEHVLATPPAARHLARARRLVRRLGSWESSARALVRGRLRDATPHSLFDAPLARDSSVIVGSRVDHAEVHAAFEERAVLERKR